MKSLVFTAKQFKKNAELAQIRSPISKTEQSARVHTIVNAIWERKGKRIRPHLVMWFGELADVPGPTLQPYAVAIESLHTATLLHDDVLDDARLRRGGPSAHLLYGNRNAILSGDYLLSDAVQSIARLGPPQILSSMCKTLKDLVTGEILQNDLRNTIPKSLQQIEQIHTLKTASLLTWGATIGPELSGKFDVELARSFMIAFGRFFQAADDLIDLQGGDGKRQWNDLQEGLVNSAVWLLLEACPEFVPQFEEAFKTREFSTLIPSLRKEARKRKMLIQSHMNRKHQDCLRLLKQFPNHAVSESLKGLVYICRNRVR